MRKHPESDLTFNHFQETNKRRCLVAFKHSLSDWTPLEWGGAAAGEMGELCNLLKKMRRGEPVAISDVADEIADVVAYLDLLASALDIDMESAVTRKFNEVSRRKECDIGLYEEPEYGIRRSRMLVALAPEK